MSLSSGPDGPSILQEVEAEQKDLHRAEVC